MLCQNELKSDPPGIPTLWQVGLLFCFFLLWGGLGAPFEHRAPKSNSRSSKMSPKIVEHHRKGTSKSLKHKQTTPEYGYQVLQKTSKQTTWPAFHPVFHVLLVLGFQTEYGYQCLLTKIIKKTMAGVPSRISCHCGA